MQKFSDIFIEVKDDLFTYIKTQRKLIELEWKRELNYGNILNQLIAILDKFWFDSNIFDEALIHILSLILYKEKKFDIAFLSSFRKDWISIEILKKYFSWDDLLVCKWFKYSINKYLIRNKFLWINESEKLIFDLFSILLIKKDIKKNLKNEFNFLKKENNKILNKNEIESFEKIKEDKKNNDFIKWIDKHILSFISNKNEWNLEKILYNFEELIENIKYQSNLEYQNHFIKEQIKSILKLYKKELNFTKKEIKDFVFDISNKNDIWLIKQGWNYDFLIKKLKWFLENKEDDFVKLKYLVLLWILYTCDFNWEFMK